MKIYNKNRVENRDYKEKIFNRRIKFVKILINSNTLYTIFNSCIIEVMYVYRVKELMIYEAVC
jgi:hypothetical protein